MKAANIARLDEQLGMSNVPAPGALDYVVGHCFVDIFFPRTGNGIVHDSFSLQVAVLR